MATFTLMTTDAGLQAPRLTGTLTTNGTTAVVGVGTEFVADLVGYTFRFVGGTVDYTIASVTDATHLTTTTAVPVGSGQIAFLSSDQGLLAANFHLLGTAAVADATDFQTANASTTLLGNTTTGTGPIVLATNPTFTTPTLGAATATSLTTPTIKPGIDSTSAIGFANAAGTVFASWDTTNKRLGLGTANPDREITIVNASSFAGIHIKGAGDGYNHSGVFMEGNSNKMWALVHDGSNNVAFSYFNGSSWVGYGFYVTPSREVIANAAPMTVYYTTSTPTMNANGQLCVGYVSSGNRLYFRSNGGTHYVNATAGFEIPSDADDPTTGGRRDETIDPISGEQMGVDDLVVGIVDRSFPNDDPSKPNCLHGVWTKHTSAHAKMGGASGTLTCDGKPILCDGKPVQVVNGLIVLASE